MTNQAPSVLVPQVGAQAPETKPMSQVASAAKAPVGTVPPKEAARLRKAHVPRGWDHHREDKDGNPIPPGPTTVYREKGDPTSALVCKTEEEYIDALNKGARDSFAPEAWE